jgi:hypothetical protein
VRFPFAPFLPAPFKTVPEWHVVISTLYVYTVPNDDTMMPLAHCACQLFFYDVPLFNFTRPQPLHNIAVSKMNDTERMMSAQRKPKDMGCGGVSETAAPQ